MKIWTVHPLSRAYPVCLTSPDSSGAGLPLRLPITA
ncbi:MAG: hypothetical protein QOF77_2137 [Solirubrobacteraceae bacterium]|nr:hypothetical protein [Solirubrobacteraceae bacterium]